MSSARGNCPLSILHVVAPAPFGGLESVLRMMAAGHLARGHAVRVAAVLSPGAAPHPFVAALDADGIPSSVVRVGDRDYLGERRAIRALCREHRPDVVHTHGFRPDAVDGAVAREERVAVVTTCHGFLGTGWRGALYEWVQRRTLRRYDAVVAVSAPIERTLRAAGIPAERVHLVPNAFVPSRNALPREAARHALDLPDVPIIGWVGRLSAEKAPDIALEAFARCAHPMAHLAVIGAGRDTESLARLARDLGIADRVLWRAAVPTAGDLFSAFDVFLLSSRTEGTPIALLEAMAAGTPIIATRVGGVPDVVNASSARLVASEDVAEMARALDDVLAHPAAALDRAARAGERLAEHYAVDPWLMRYEAIYRSVSRPVPIGPATPGATGAAGRGP